MRPRISIRGCVRPSVGPSVRWSVGPSVRQAFLKHRGNRDLRTTKYQGTHRIAFLVEIQENSRKFSKIQENSRKFSNLLDASLFESNLSHFCSGSSQYRAVIDQQTPNICPACNQPDRNVKHLFKCAHRNQMKRNQTQLPLLR